MLFYQPKLKSAKPNIKILFVAQASNSFFSTLVILPIIIDNIAAAKLNNAPIFAASCTGPASKATVATNNETVNRLLIRIQ